MLSSNCFHRNPDFLKRLDLFGNESIQPRGIQLAALLLSSCLFNGTHHDTKVADCGVY